MIINQTRVKAVEVSIRPKLTYNYSESQINQLPVTPTGTHVWKSKSGGFRLNPVLRPSTKNIVTREISCYLCNQYICHACRPTIRVV